MDEEVAAGLRGQFTTIFLWAGILWLVFIFDKLVNTRIRQRYGLRPRTIGNFPTLISWLFLHADIAHLRSNFVPLLFFAWLVMLTNNFWLVSLIIVVVQGVGVWLWGRGDAIFIGASGLIYGYWGYLLSYGFFSGNGRLFAAALVLAWFTRYTILGIFPQANTRIAWEGHLFGLIGGLVAAWWLVP